MCPAARSIELVVKGPFDLTSRQRTAALCRTYVFTRRPLSLAFRPFIASNLKVAFGSRLCENVDWVRILVVDSGFLMKRFVEGEDRRQGVLLPEYLDDFVSEENQVRVIEAFVDELDLAALEFDGMTPAATGRPSYHPSMLLKIYVYGYINQIASSRRLEREAGRNVELMWLTGRLTPDFKTIADFRKDN